MFLFRDDRSSTPSRQYAWFCAGWIVLLIALFIWSRWTASTVERDIAQVKEDLICFYLDHDYTIPPHQVMVHLPNKIQRHIQRVAPIIEQYHRGGMAHEDAAKWLREGDWDYSTVGRLQDHKKGHNCLERAIARGQLSNPSKKRVFMAMASQLHRDLQNHQSRLDKLSQKYLEAHRRHPWSAWGMIPAQRSPVTWLTALFLSAAWFVLLLHVGVLWLMAGFIERYWGAILWMAAYLLGGIIGNLALMFLLWGNVEPVLGSTAALSSVIGFFAFAIHNRPLSFVVAKAKVIALPVQPRIAGFGLILLLLLLFDIVASNHNVIALFITQLLGLGIGAGIYRLLCNYEWFEPLVDEHTVRQEVALRKPPVTHQRQRFFQQSQVADGQKGKYLKPDLRHLVLEEKQNRNYTTLIGLYRELYTQGQARLEDFDELFIAYAKAEQIPRVEDFVRAIRSAALEKIVDKARNYYNRFDALREQIGWTLREQIELATELKRAGLYDEAIANMEDILDEGPDSRMFMEALILKAETMIARRDDLEDIARMIYKTELYLETQPQYRDNVAQLREKFSELESANSDQEEHGRLAVQAIENFLQKSPDEPASASIEVDTDLLDDIEQMENQILDLQDEQDQPNSWAELPTLLLRRDEGALASLQQDEPETNASNSSMKQPDIDDFLHGDGLDTSFTLFEQNNNIPDKFIPNTIDPLVPTQATDAEVVALPQFIEQEFVEPLVPKQATDAEVVALPQFIEQELVEPLVPTQATDAEVEDLPLYFDPENLIERVDAQASLGQKENEVAKKTKQSFLMATIHDPMMIEEMIWEQETLSKVAPLEISGLHSTDNTSSLQPKDLDIWSQELDILADMAKDVSQGKSAMGVVFEQQSQIPMERTGDELDHSESFGRSSHPEGSILELSQEAIIKVSEEIISHYLASGESPAKDETLWEIGKLGAHFSAVNSLADRDQTLLEIPRISEVSKRDIKFNGQLFKDTDSSEDPESGIQQIEGGSVRHQPHNHQPSVIDLTDIVVTPHNKDKDK